MCDVDVERLVAALRPLTERVRTDVSAVKRDGFMGWTNQPLTLSRLRAHLSGGPARGVCPIQAGDDRTCVGLLDVDDHDDSQGWAGVTQWLERIDQALTARGLCPFYWRSSGGSGAHVFVLWDQLQDAYSVRALLCEALTDIGLANGAGGLSRGQVEVFPKQNSVPADGYGNQFVLPLAGESVPLEPMLGFEALTRSDAADTQWLFSPDVEVREKPPESGAATASDVSLAELTSAVRAIPNHDHHELDYDTWRNVVFAIHYVDSGPDGLALAHEFSARSSKYDAAFLDNSVWPYIRSDRDHVVPGDYVLTLARQQGWGPPAEVVAEEFDFQPPAEAGEEDEEPEMPAGLEREKSGQPKASIGNVVLMLERGQRKLGWRVAWDNFMGAAMISEVGQTAWREVTDADYTRLRVRFEETGVGFKPVSKEMIRDALDLAAERQQFDSAQLWLREEVPAWDGVERIAQFWPRYFACEDSDYARACGRYIWTALAGRVLTPGVQADMAPVLIGEQGLRKSSGVQALVPDPSFFFEVDLTRKDDDLARQMRGKLVGELDELRGLGKRDVDHMKSLVTRRYERWVPKYREKEVCFPRRCVLIGTTNNHEFLIDETGHRRFLPLECGEVDVEGLQRDRGQLWAEARETYLREGVLHFEAERLAQQYHQAHVIEDPWQAAIERWLESDPLNVGHTRGEQPFTTDEVMREALQIPTGNANGLAGSRVASVLRRLGFEQKRKASGSGARVRKWCPK